MKLKQNPFGIVEVAAMPVIEIDPPTGALVLDLPAPPSINRLGAEWRLGNSSSKVKRWRRAADGHLLYTRQSRRLGNPIRGYFACDILWDRSLADELHSDIDNRIKFLLDYLQHLRLFQDDSLCRSLTANYDNVPDGCRVRLRPWEW